MELTEDWILSEVERVIDRNKRKGRASCGEPESLVLKCSEREFVHAVAGKAVGHLLTDILYRELRRIDIVQLVVRNHGFPYGIVHIDAGTAADHTCADSCNGSDRTENSLHLLKTVVKTIIRIDIGPVFK